MSFQACSQVPPRVGQDASASSPGNPRRVNSAFIGPGQGQEQATCKTSDKMRSAGNRRGCGKGLGSVGQGSGYSPSSLRGGERRRRQLRIVGAVLGLDLVGAAGFARDAVGARSDR